MRATLTFECDAPTAQVHMGGDLDLSTGVLLTDAFACLELSGCTRLEVDADDVTFIDAYTLALLRAEQRRLRESAGDLRVTAGSSYYRLVCGLAEYQTLQPGSDHVFRHDRTATTRAAAAPTRSCPRRARRRP
ncbi:hypothetical protein JCM18899A_32270 [Nocardioides sp. AN3]